MLGKPLRIEINAPTPNSQVWFDNVHLLSEDPTCTPHKARAVAQLFNGIFVGATIADHGCGYTNAPMVTIQGGGLPSTVGSSPIRQFSIGLRDIVFGRAPKNLCQIENFIAASQGLCNTRGQRNGPLGLFLFGGDPVMAKGVGLDDIFIGESEQDWFGPVWIGPELSLLASLAGNLALREKGLRGSFEEVDD